VGRSVRRRGRRRGEDLQDVSTGSVMGGMGDRVWLQLAVIQKGRVGQKCIQKVKRERGQAGVLAFVQTLNSAADRRLAVQFEDAQEIHGIVEKPVGKVSGRCFLKVHVNFLEAAGKGHQ